MQLVKSLFRTGELERGKEINPVYNKTKNILLLVYL